MSMRLTVEGGSVADAVRRAVARLAATEDDEVVISLAAPGFDPDELGTVRLTLEVFVDDTTATPGEVTDVVTAAPPTAAPAPSATDDQTDAASDGDATTSAPAETVEDDAAGEDVGLDEDDDDEVSVEDLDEEADAAADFLEGLLDALDLPGDLQIRVHDDHAEVELVNVGSGRLIGRRGQTLDAIQELVRSALQRRFERRTRVVIDIEGYRSRRMEKVLEKANEVIEDVLDSGRSQRLEPMDVHERRAVHQLVATREGVMSSSRGREPTRRVVIEPEDDGAA